MAKNDKPQDPSTENVAVPMDNAAMSRLLKMVEEQSRQLAEMQNKLDAQDSSKSSQDQTNKVRPVPIKEVEEFIASKRPDTEYYILHDGHAPSGRPQNRAYKVLDRAEWRDNQQQLIKQDALSIYFKPFTGPGADLIERDGKPRYFVSSIDICRIKRMAVTAEDAKVLSLPPSMYDKNGRLLERPKVAGMFDIQDINRRIRELVVKNRRLCLDEFMFPLPLDTIIPGEIYRLWVEQEYKLVWEQEARRKALIESAKSAGGASAPGFAKLGKTEIAA